MLSLSLNTWLATSETQPPWVLSSVLGQLWFPSMSGGNIPGSVWVLGVIPSNVGWFYQQSWLVASHACAGQYSTSQGDPPQTSQFSLCACVALPTRVLWLLVLTALLSSDSDLWGFACVFPSCIVPPECLKAFSWDSYRAHLICFPANQGSLTFISWCPILKAVVSYMHAHSHAYILIIWLVGFRKEHISVLTPSCHGAEV